MFKPKNIVNLVKERVEVQDDVKHKVHEYEYDYKYRSKGFYRSRNDGFLGSFLENKYLKEHTYLQ